MTKPLRFVAVAVLLTFAALPALAQYKAAQGWCEQGGVKALVPGTPGSTQSFQQSYPACTVTVYDAGTITLSTIYSNSTGTAKANPFTAASNGWWFYFAALGSYDIVLSGGGLAAPITLNSVGISEASLDPIFNSITVGPALASDSSVGNNLLAKWNGTAWVLASTSDTGSMTQIVASGGTTSLVYLYVYGVIPCTFDGATTNGDWVIVSTTVAGNCHDSGIAQTANPPSGVRVLGIVLSTNAASGVYSVFWNPYYVRTTSGVFNPTSGKLPINSLGSFVDSPLDYDTTNSGVMTSTKELVLPTGSSVSDLGLWFGLVANKNGFYATASNVIGVAQGTNVMNLAQTAASFSTNVTTQKMFGSGVATNTDGFGQCTLGTDCTITFTGTYLTAPICVATDTSAAAAVRVVVNTTTLTITGTGTDVINYACFFRT